MIIAKILSPMRCSFAMRSFIDSCSVFPRGAPLGGYRWKTSASSSANNTRANGLESPTIEVPRTAKQTWQIFVRNAQPIGVVLALAGALFLSGATINNAKRDVQLVEMKLKKDIQLARVQAQRDVEVAKKETMENFLKYGYAEEFLRYQKVVGVAKGMEEENQDTNNN